MNKREAQELMRKLDKLDDICTRYRNSSEPSEDVKLFDELFDIASQAKELLKSRCVDLTLDAPFSDRSEVK